MTRQPIQLLEKPLVTLGLCAYNQEHLIQEAIEAAFAQTYRPLEIVLSDDCSRDSTFAIIQEMAASYKGPHSVVINRNETNLGLCGHVNRVCAIAKGCWLVSAAGDDVSLPHRVDEIMHWVQKYPDAGYTMSQAIIFSSEQYAQRYNDTIFNKPLGATEAFSLAMFNRFGALLPETCGEDWSLYFRAQLTGSVLFIESPLIRYRMSSASLTSHFYKSGLVGQLRTFLTDLKQFSRDVAAISDEYGSFLELRFSLEQRTRFCETLLHRLVSGKIRWRDIKEIAGSYIIPMALRVSLLALYVAPSLYVFHERLRRSRFYALSANHYALTYLNPLSLLLPPTRCGGTTTEGRNAV